MFFEYLVIRAKLRTRALDQGAIAAPSSTNLPLSTPYDFFVIAVYTPPIWAPAFFDPGLPFWE